MKNVWSRYAEGSSSRVRIVVSGGGGDIEIHFCEGLVGAQIVLTLAHFISNTLQAIITLAVIFSLFLRYCSKPSTYRL